MDKIDPYVALNICKMVTFWTSIIAFACAGFAIASKSGENYFNGLIKKIEQEKHESRINDLSEKLKDSGKKVASMKDKIPDRFITETQKKTVLPLLQEASGAEVTIRVTSNDRESNSYAKQFVNLFKDSGWKVNGPIINVVSGSFRGVGIQIKDDKARPASLVTIEKAFGVLNLKATGELQKDLGLEEVIIFVGAQ